MTHEARSVELEWLDPESDDERAEREPRPDCARKSCRHSFERHQTAGGFCKHCPCQVYLEAHK